MNTLKVNEHTSVLAYLIREPKLSQLNTLSQKNHDYLVSSGQSKSFFAKIKLFSSVMNIRRKRERIKVMGKGERYVYTRGVQGERNKRL